MNTVSKINAELVDVSSWLKTNKLSLSVRKCIYIIFHTIRTKVNTLQLVIDNTIVKKFKNFILLK